MIFQKKYIIIDELELKNNLVPMKLKENFFLWLNSTTFHIKSWRKEVASLWMTLTRKLWEISTIFGWQKETRSTNYFTLWFCFHILLLDVCITSLCNYLYKESTLREIHAEENLFKGCNQVLVDKEKNLDFDVAKTRFSVTLEIMPKNLIPFRFVLCSQSNWCDINEETTVIYFKVSKYLLI